MSTTDEVIFYHAPRTRSATVLGLLEELQAPYRLELLDMQSGAQRDAAYLAINPMGKVPAIVHHGALVTETIAITIYLADAFPQMALAPQIGDPLRGPYLRWLAFYGASFEPACVDKALNREPGRPSMMPYGDYETAFKTVVDQLGRGPFITGDRFTAADTVWGAALGWLTAFGIVAETPVITDYISRIQSRPAVQRAQGIDAEILAKRAG